MDHFTVIGIPLSATFLLNIPFGYWRAYAKVIDNRREWFLAIHAPVPLVFLLRILSHASIWMIPLFVSAFFIGQYTGGLLHARLESTGWRTSRCLFNDILYRYIK